MVFVLARKLDGANEQPELHNRQFVEFGGAWYRVCSMCHGTQEELLRTLGDERMQGVARTERYDTVVAADHDPIKPLVVRDVVGLDVFRTLRGAAET